VRNTLFCVCLVLTIALVAQENIEVRPIDKDEPFKWVRLSQLDPFDDTEYFRVLTYYVAPEIAGINWPEGSTSYDFSQSTLFSIARVQTTEDIPCYTLINVVVPTTDLTEQQLRNTTLSFNFKRFKTITRDGRFIRKSDPLDDLKILDLKVDRQHIEFTEEETLVGTRLIYSTKVKQILEGMLQSSEMRVRVKFDDKYFNLKVDLPHELDSELARDKDGETYMKGTISHVFERKWAWATELCEHSVVDSDEDSAEETTDD